MKNFFTAIGRWIKKHKVITILIVIVLIAALVCAFVLPKLLSKSAAPTMQQQTNTVTLSKMDLTSSVSATGTIESASTKTVSATLQDVEVNSVAVEEGDTVNKGDTLVTFDQSDLQDALDTAKDNLSDANTQASSSLSTAQRQLSDAKDTYSSSKIKLAKSVSSAKSTYTSAKTKVATLKKKVAAASGAEKTQLQEQLTQAQTELSQSKTAYENAVSEQEQQNKQNKSSVQSAKDNITTTKSNNKKSIKEAQTQVDEASDNLAACAVVAPMSGTITAVGVEAGDSYSGGDMFEISDLDNLQVSTTIDEYDISNIQKGQKVVILTDATGDDEIEGEITYVSKTTGSSLSSSSDSSGSGSASMGTTSSSTSTSGYTVTIKITTTDERLLVGMTAKCSIVLEEAADVYAVPYDAIHTNANGDSVIYVMENNSQKEVTVTQGMESDYYVEITGDDLSEGLSVVIPSDETSTSTTTDSSSDSSALSGLMGGSSDKGNRGNMSGGGGMPGGGMPN